MSERRFKALDLFCKAGGVTKGLQRAGFYVVGVDIEPQPRYVGDEFFQADALTFPLDGYDLICASPPCQAFTDLQHMWNAKRHADLLTPIRERLRHWGGPYIIENVEGAPLINPMRLCGTSFNLRTSLGAELRRHRLFESNLFLLTPPCRHGVEARVIGVYGGHGRDRRRKANTQDFPTWARREAMGIDWMNGVELSQAIPPAYSEFLGRQVMTCLEGMRRVETEAAA